jgi:predicted nucleic acid-binding protein
MAKKRSAKTKLDAFVLDASVTLAWYFEGESNTYADAVADQFPAVQAIVPAIWPLEVANAVVIGERRKRGTILTATQWATYLSALPIAVDESLLRRTFNDILAIARDQTLSVYDASYLELAIRSGLPLASLDTKLRAAAKALGVRSHQP